LVWLEIARGKPDGPPDILIIAEMIVTMVKPRKRVC